MRAEYARNHEETLGTSPQIVSFFKTFVETEGDFRLFDLNLSECKYIRQRILKGFWQFCSAVRIAEFMAFIHRLVPPPPPPPKKTVFRKLYILCFEVEGWEEPQLGQTKEICSLTKLEVSKWVGISVYLRAHTAPVAEKSECLMTDRIQTISNPKCVCDCWQIC